MVTVGVDAHKRSHTLVVVDGNGKQLAATTVESGSAGHTLAQQWAGQWPQRRWALEDCRPMSGRLEQDLLLAGEVVVRVAPKLMAQARRGGRSRGKSDPIDALAAARAALQEPDLPQAQLGGEEIEIKLLVAHREDLVAERTRIQNRLHDHLHQLDPSFRLGARTLSSRATWLRLQAFLEGLAGRRCQLARELVARVAELTSRIDELKAELDGLTARLSPHLRQLQGCGALTAAKIIAETADITRFKNSDAFAMFNGTAPIPACSGNSTHHRLNRGGNRQANTALHVIAITQFRLGGPGRAYVTKRMASNKTKKDALRCLRRHLSNEVYRRLILDRQTRSSAPITLAA